MKKTTTYCPICLCFITSEPWGVVSPCGHPYHRDCWAGVVAHHASGESGRNRSAGEDAQCATCKVSAKGFLHVFVNLGDDDDCQDSGGAGGHTSVLANMTDTGGEHCGLIHINVNDRDEDDYAWLEKLRDEWDGLLKELEMTICGSESSEEGTDIVDTPDHSGRNVASICVAIEPKCLSPVMHDDLNRDRRSSASSHTPLRKSGDERMNMKQILNRLQCIQEEILGSLQWPRRQNSPSIYHSFRRCAGTTKGSRVARYYKRRKLAGRKRC
jgi:hypothetical protein